MRIKIIIMTVKQKNEFSVCVCHWKMIMIREKTEKNNRKIENNKKRK